MTKIKNGWDIVSSNYCSDIQLQCNGFKYIYTENHIIYKRLSDKIKITSGICGAIIATIGFVTISNLSNLINIAVAVLGLFVTILSVFSSVWKIDEIITSSYNAASNFEHLESDIIYQFTLKKSERINCNEYKQYLLERFKASKAAAPIITEDLQAKLMKKNPKSYEAIYGEHRVNINTIDTSSEETNEEVCDDQDNDNDHDNDHDREYAASHDFAIDHVRSHVNERDHMNDRNHDQSRIVSSERIILPTRINETTNTSEIKNRPNVHSDPLIRTNVHIDIGEDTPIRSEPGLRNEPVIKYDISSRSDPLTHREIRFSASPDISKIRPRPRVKIENKPSPHVEEHFVPLNMTTI